MSGEWGKKKLLTDDRKISPCLARRRVLAEVWGKFLRSVVERERERLL